MKGEYLEDQENNHPHHNYNAHHHMFPKFPPPHLHYEPDISAGEPSKKPKTSAAGDDGSTVEVPRRPRGRPPGSKNKPRPPVVITREPDQPAMSPFILELPGNSDIVDSLTRFTRRRGISICVLTATGAVADVTLKQPVPPAGATVTFHGRFDILSLSAVFLVQTASYNGLGGPTISLAGPQGQIVGGMVVGPLISAGTVYVVATSFNSPSFHRLPLDDHEEEEQEEREFPAVGGGDGRSRSPVSGGSSAGGQMGMYSGCHMGMGSSSSDLMWASTVRPSLPPPY